MEGNSSTGYGVEDDVTQSGMYMTDKDNSYDPTSAQINPGSKGNEPEWKVRPNYVPEPKKYKDHAPRYLEQGIPHRVAVACFIINILVAWCCMIAALATPGWVVADFPQTVRVATVKELTIKYQVFINNDNWRTSAGFFVLGTILTGFTLAGGVSMFFTKKTIVMTKTSVVVDLICFFIGLLVFPLGYKDLGTLCDHKRTISQSDQTGCGLTDGFRHYCNHQTGPNATYITFKDNELCDPWKEGPSFHTMIAAYVSCND
eukprot:UC4_evm2s642